MECFRISAIVGGRLETTSHWLRDSVVVHWWWGWKGRVTSSIRHNRGKCEYYTNYYVRVGRFLPSLVLHTTCRLSYMAHLYKGNTAHLGCAQQSSAFISCNTQKNADAEQTPAMEHFVLFVFRRKYVIYLRMILVPVGRGPHLSKAHQ